MKVGPTRKRKEQNRKRERVNKNLEVLTDTNSLDQEIFEMGKLSVIAIFNCKIIIKRGVVKRKNIRKEREKHEPLITPQPSWRPGKVLPSTVKDFSLPTTAKGIKSCERAHEWKWRKKTKNIEVNNTVTILFAASPSWS